jgi:flagellar biosynthesis protein FlhF
MKMKQITAKNMQEALELARQQLGENAVLLQSRKAAGNAGITVTFAVEPESDGPPVGAEAKHPALPLLERVLHFHRIDEPMLSRLQMAGASTRVGNASPFEAAQTMLAQALEKTFEFAPLSEAASPPMKATMLIGMHGVGKTTAIAKLATMLALLNRPMVLISTDGDRFGGTDALASLARILNVPFHVATNRNDLKALLKGAVPNAHVLIDSAGVNIYEFSALKNLGELAGLQQVEPVLVAAAGMDAAESLEMASVFSFLPITRLIVTRSDAARHWSGIFSAMTHHAYRLANMSSSASPADPCQPMTPQLLAARMMTAERERLTQ